MKKSLSTTLVAALLITAPGPLATRAAAQVFTGNSRVAPITSALNVTGSSLKMNIAAPTAIPGLANVPGLTGFSVKPITPIPSQTVLLVKPIAATGNAATMTTFLQPAGDRTDDATNLNNLFENSIPSAITDGPSVLGRTDVSPRLPLASNVSTTKFSSAVPLKKDGTNGGSIATIGFIGAVAILAGYIFSPTFRATVKRILSATLGWTGLFARKLETPEAMAERLTQQLEQEEKAYDALVQEAATEVARIAGEIEALQKKFQILQDRIEAILMDSDEKNDPAAGKPKGEQEVVQVALEAMQASLTAAQANLENAQLERTRFYTTKAQKIEEVKSTLSKVRRARFETRQAELKKQHTSGDRQNTGKRLEEAAQEVIAKGKGAKTAAETNPDAIADQAVAEATERKRNADLKELKEKLEKKKDGTNGGSIATIGFIGAVAILAGYIFSPTFRATVKRILSATLGWTGLFARKLETPEAMAERLTQQLEQEEKAYDALVQEAATEVARIAGEIEALQKKFQILQDRIEAILMDSDEKNDPAAGKPKGEQEVVQVALEAMQASLTAAQANLENAQLERTRFYTTKAQKIEEVKSTLSKVRRARFETRQAELKKQHTSGDRQNTGKRLEEAAQEVIAKGKGAKTAAETNPDAIADQAVAEATERKRNADLKELKEKLEKKKDGLNGGYINAKSVKLLAGAVAVGLSLLAPLWGTAALVVAGLIAMAALSPKNQKSTARILFGVGGTTGIIGALSLVVASKFGVVLSLGFGSAFGFFVPAVMAVIMGVLLYRSAGKKASVSIAQPQPVALGNDARPIAAVVPTVLKEVAKTGEVIVDMAEKTAAAAKEASAAALEVSKKAHAAANTALTQFAASLETPAVKREMYEQAIAEQERLIDKAISAAALAVARLLTAIESPEFKKVSPKTAAKITGDLQESIKTLDAAQAQRASLRGSL